MLLVEPTELESSTLIGAPSRARSSGSALKLLLGLGLLGLGCMEIVVTLLTRGKNPGSIAMDVDTVLGILCPGGFLILLGTHLILGSWFHVLLGWRAWTMRRTPSDPSCLRDYPWPRDRIVNDQHDDWYEIVLVTVFACLVVLADGIVVWLGAPSRVITKVVLGLANLVMLGLVLWAAMRFRQLRKYGQSFLQWERFPVPLGQAIRLTVTCSRPIGRVEELQARLCCIQESQVGAGRQAQEIVERVWGQELRLLEDTHIDAGEPIELHFTLPDQPLGTMLSVPSPRYWELVVWARTTGIDYWVSFIVPVY